MLKCSRVESNTCGAVTPQHIGPIITHRLGRKTNYHGRPATSRMKLNSGQKSLSPDPHTSDSNSARMNDDHAV